jgi:cytolysin (calcineurin-like family phosphatase)
MPISPTSFSVIISSDPQYPWYDGVLPPGITNEDEKARNSERQIRQQYEDMNQLHESRRADSFPIQAVLINGDLTAFGHDWQHDKYKELVGLLKIPYYPGLGNHDYANNINDCALNNCATRMVHFLRVWLNGHPEIERDLVRTKSYEGEIRLTYTGSLAYAFNIGAVHFVQLHNYPSYRVEWNTWNLEGNRDFFVIRPAFYWLRRDLANARNRGDAIIVNLHDYGEHFKEADRRVYAELMADYGVSAVFAGHIHPHCGKIGTLEGTTIPFFRSGSASYQNYLVADFDTVSRTMSVRKRQDPGERQYAFTSEEWREPLDMTVPEPPRLIPAAEGYVTFFNEGGFVAGFEVRYRVDGVEHRHETGVLALGNKRTFFLPPEATDVRVLGHENSGVGWWTVFDTTFPSPPNRCFRLFGTTLNPKWDNC